jgi:hypothetical protein
MKKGNEKERDFVDKFGRVIVPFISLGIWQLLLSLRERASVM